MARRWRSCCQWASPKPGRKSPARPLSPRGSSPPPTRPLLFVLRRREATGAFLLRCSRRPRAGGAAGGTAGGCRAAGGCAPGAARGCCTARGMRRVPSAGGYHPPAAAAVRQERSPGSGDGGERRRWRVLGGRQVPSRGAPWSFSPPPAEGPRSSPPVPPGERRCEVWDRQGGNFLHPRLKSKPRALKIRSPWRNCSRELVHPGGFL